MSKHHKNNNNNNRFNNDEVEKMSQKNGSCKEGSCDNSMKKGAAQGEQNKPMQQGKPAVQGQQSGYQNKPVQGQKPEHSQGKPESFKKNK